MTQVLDCIFSHAQVAKKNQLVIMLIVRWGPVPQVGAGRGGGFSPASSFSSFSFSSSSFFSPCSSLSPSFPCSQFWHRTRVLVLLGKVLCHKATSPEQSPTVF